jgi:hypothetical protein
MKKRVLLALVLVMVLALSIVLVACGENDPPAVETEADMTAADLSNVVEYKYSLYPVEQTPRVYNTTLFPNKPTTNKPTYDVYTYRGDGYTYISVYKTEWVLRRVPTDPADLDRLIFEYTGTDPANITAEQRAQYAGEMYYPFNQHTPTTYVKIGDTYYGETIYNEAGNSSETFYTTESAKTFEELADYEQKLISMSPSTVTVEWLEDEFNITKPPFTNIGHYSTSNNLYPEFNAGYYADNFSRLSVDKNGVVFDFNLLTNEGMELLIGFQGAETAMTKIPAEEAYAELQAYMGGADRVQSLLRDALYEVEDYDAAKLTAFNTQFSLNAERIIEAVLGDKRILVAFNPDKASTDAIEAMPIDTTYFSGTRYRYGYVFMYGDYESIALVSYNW